MTDDPQALADAYAQLWNEPDAAQRQATIGRLFAPDAVHRVRSLEAHGHAALTQRVSDAYNKNVRDAGHRFRARRGAQRLHDTVIFQWEMLPATGDQALALGLDVLQLDAEGRILRDYQVMLA